MAEPFLERMMHPTTIVTGYYRAMEDALEILNKIAVKLDVDNRKEVGRCVPLVAVYSIFVRVCVQLQAVVDACLGTKFVTRWGQLMTNMALDAVLTVMRDVDGQREIDFKRYAHVEKVDLLLSWFFLLPRA